MINIAVVIPASQPDLLESSLELISGSAADDYHLTTILVVNNFDPSIWQSTRTRPDYLVRNPTDYGEAAGLNSGIALALDLKPDFIWLMDPGVSFSSESLIHLLVAAKKMPRVGIFVPKIYQATAGKLLCSVGGSLDSGATGFKWRGAGQQDLGQYDHDLEVDVAPLYCLFARAKVFAAAGLLDPHFYEAFVEADFSTRARRNGFAIVVAAQSRMAYSPPSRSPDRATYFSVRNRLLFGLKQPSLLSKIYALRQSAAVLKNGTVWEKKAASDFLASRFGAGPFESL